MSLQKLGMEKLKTVPKSTILDFGMIKYVAKRDPICVRFPANTVTA